MHLDEIIELLDRTHVEINGLLDSMDQAQFQSELEGKWSIAQQVIHLKKSLIPLANGLRKHRLILRYLFGRPNRSPRDYETVKQRYYEKAADIPPGVNSPFVPQSEDDTDPDKVKREYREAQEELRKVLSRWKDRHLDRILLPHPLLGKVTVREMLYFTDFHTIHHMKSIQEAAQMHRGA